MIKRSEVSGIAVDLVDNKTVKIEITREQLLAIKNRDEVLEQFSYGTPVYIKDSATTPNNKIMYYDCSVDEVPLDDYRLMERTEEEDARVKEYMIGGLLSTLYLVSEGKIYDTVLNPLNFIYDQRRNKVKMVYRKDSAVGEITDKWLYDVKKLVAFFLVNDSGLLPERFQSLRIEDIEKLMSAPTLNGFLRLKSARSVGEMAEMLLSDKQMLPLVSYPSVFTNYQKPRDITTEIGYVPTEGGIEDVQDMFYEAEDAAPRKEKKGILGFGKGKDKGEKSAKEKPVKEKPVKVEKPIKDRGIGVTQAKKDLTKAEQIIREERYPSQVGRKKMLVGIMIGIVIGILFDQFVLASILEQYMPSLDISGVSGHRV